MKFKELFEIYDVIDSDVSDHVNNGELLGRGKYSYVKDHPEDSHLVVKRANPHGVDIDPYPLFVKALVADEIWKRNPHFPRIYTQSDKSWTMEKLVDGNSLDADILMGWVRTNMDSGINRLLRVLPIEAASVYIKTGLFNTTSEELNVTIVKEILRHIARVLKYYEELTSPKLLREAMDWIAALIEKSNSDAGTVPSSNDFIRMDIHSDNFMWRRDPHGIQLVITDPIW